MRLSPGHSGSKFNFEFEFKFKHEQRGLRLTPGGLRPQHPQRGGKRRGNAGQHGTRVARRQGASNRAPGQQQTRVHQQASLHQQQEPQPKNKACNNRAHSITNRAETSGKEAVRMQEPRHTKVADIGRFTGVNMQCLAYLHGSHSVTRQTSKSSSHKSVGSGQPGGDAL
jgi:hypothetical protein